MCQVEPGYVLVHNPCGIVRPVRPRKHAWPRQPADALGHGAVIVDNLIPGMTELAEALRQNWRQALGAPARVRTIPHSRPVDAALLDELATAGLALLGLGNCGACTTWLAELGAELVTRMPVALVVTDRFAAVAGARLSALGEPGLPVLAVPDDAADATAQYLAPVAAQIVADCARRWHLPHRDPEEAR